MAEDANAVRDVVVEPQQSLAPRRLAGKLRRVVEIRHLVSVGQGKKVEQSLSRRIDAVLGNQHSRKRRLRERIVDERQLGAVIIEALAEVSFALESGRNQHVLHGIGRQLPLIFLAEEEESLVPGAFENLRNVDGPADEITGIV